MFILPLVCMVAAVNWYVDSYAYLRVTYDRISEEMAERGMNVEGLQESDFNDRKLLLACLNRQTAPKEIIVAGSSRVMNFDHTMFGTDSFYNTGLSESTVYDLLAVAGILDRKGQLPEKMIIGVDAFLFNASHDNDRWKDLEDYEIYMEEKIANRQEDASRNAETAGGRAAELQVDTGRDNAKWLSLDYFRYNITRLWGRRRFEVDYTTDWETECYLKHYDGSIAYERSLREVDVSEVEALTGQSIGEHVVYRLTDYQEIDAESMALFSGLTDYLQSRGVEVIWYLPPYSPMMYNYIESEEQFRIALQVEDSIRKKASERGIALYGSYDPAGCGLEMGDLYDVYHVKTEKMPDTFYRVQ